MENIKSFQSQKVIKFLTIIFLGSILLTASAKFKIDRGNFRSACIF